MKVTITLRDDPLAENPDNVAVDVTFDPPLSESDKVSPAAAMSVELVDSVFFINEAKRQHRLATMPRKRPWPLS